MPKELPPYFQKYLDDKFDMVIAEIKEVKCINEILSQRVTALEAFKWQFVSFIAFIGIVWTLFGNAVGGFLKDVFGHLYKS